MSHPAKQPPFHPAHDSERGFVELSRTLFGQDVPHLSNLLVPADVAETILAEEQAAKEKREADEHDRSMAAITIPSPAVTPKTLPAPCSRKAHPKAGEEHEQQEDVWRQHAQSMRRRSGKRWHRIFDPGEALRLSDLIGRYHRDDRQRLQRIYDQLATAGNARAVARPSPDALRTLAAVQPHMAEVVEFIDDQLRLGEHARRPVRIPPILIAGEPGIGKTHFAQCLARALRAPMRIQPLDTDITGALLLGSDRKWATSQHGLLFELVALGEVANPVVVLDEIDKGHRVDNQVQACLYSVLEPVSATRLRDISLDFEFDASLVTWIATANDAYRLDAPLRSRFKEFHIPVPNAEQCLVIAREVVAATIRDASVPGFSTQTGRLECVLAHLTAREIQQLVRQAIARALKNGRKAVEISDLPLALSGRGEVEETAYLH